MAPEKFACLKGTRDGCLLLVHAVPRASRTELVDLHGDRCKMRVKAPPVDGAANEALVAFLAKAFGLSRSAVKLQRGATGKQKEFLLTGLDEARVAARLRELLPANAGAAPTTPGNGKA